MTEGSNIAWGCFYDSANLSKLADGTLVVWVKCFTRQSAEKKIYDKKYYNEYVEIAKYAMARTRSGYIPPSMPLDRDWETLNPNNQCSIC